MIDFGSLRKPDQKNRPTDPREIFKRRPSGEGAANDLWQGQAEALGAWFENPREDNLVLLNTGAGKTIVGLLIAQSYVNQGIRNVIYACSTIDLVYQTAREAKKLGLSVTCRVQGKFDNDLFEQGRAFCITTYAAALNPRTVFRGQKKPAAIIFDDAHVANRVIRESFTLQIKREDYEELYLALVETLRPVFQDMGQRMEFQAAVKEDSGTVLLVPPCGFYDLSLQVTSLLDGGIKDKDAQVSFPWLFLRDHLQFCACLVRNDAIEFTPPFLPTLTLPIFDRDVKRVYLSATLTTKADFTRVFGRSPQNVIAPNVDAGDGERLFLFASKFEKGAVDKNIIKAMSTETKVLIAVPSRERGKYWSEFAVVPERATFTERLDEFRRSNNGAFILAGRFDGIDLPGSQCRVMVADGLPTGGSLLEQFLFDRLQMDHFLANTISVRLAQLFGRIIRGRQDFGFFVIADRKVENWLKNERNRSLLPELLRKQLFLSEEIEGQIVGAIGIKEALSTMRDVIKREEGWVDFYRDNINDIDVPEGRLRQNDEEDAVLTEAGKHEVRFMTKLWDNDIVGARAELESVFKEVAIHDAVLAGWYSVWIGMTYYSEGNTEAAIDLFDEARRRIGHNLPLPRRKSATAKIDAPSKTLIEQALRDVAHGSVMKINDNLAKLRITVKDAFVSTATHRQCEEAVRAIGAALGFTSSRPCSDGGSGPDNLWVDVRSETVIAFELKTDKGADGKITKDDVGQGLNHLEWLKTHYPALKLVGLVFLTDCRNTSEKSNPAPTMYFGSQERLKSVWDDFVDTVERIRPKTEIERVAEAGKIGELPEWSCEGIFKRIVDSRMA